MTGVVCLDQARTERMPSIKSFCTQLSETPSIRSSLPRTVGTLPYPRETTAASNACGDDASLSHENVRERGRVF
jgi:hypothetical protein